MTARRPLCEMLAAARARPLINVHRGLWGPAPENSLAAIEAARPFDIVEIDVRIAADGTPFLMHDPTLERMTGMDVPSSALSGTELGRLALLQGAGGAAAVRTDQRVPLLEEALQAGRGVLFDLDVKREGDLEAVAGFLAECGDREGCTLKRDITGPGDIEDLQRLERRYGVTVLGKAMIRTGADLAVVRAAHEAGVQAVELWFAALPLLRAAAGTGIPVTTYTLDDVHCDGLSDSRARDDPAGVWGALRAAGVRGIMTDRAPALADFLSAAPAAPVAF